eukprot:TRINITY_DN25771_c0_g1_i1.p1 TRINITY_DN25771_c0_g1~~TRINITY_DN25771_c0_g1_i1.p1  ORF type:complete len:1340 (-),score=275.51 TRINITY_DN25771_c0_g1_i1:1376-5395(-)
MSNRARPSMRVKLEQDGNPVLHLENEAEGKRRRYAAPKSNEPNNGLQQQGNSTTSDGSIVFKIINQPENQHRARYQTEGSRGAIKDRSGTGFPTLKLEGYKRPVKIQIFIGNDVGKVSPHMFYQVCRVTGKNSNPCEEKKIDGTDIIEITSEPQSDMAIICDCVGILKERFADVEARFPKHKNWKNSKKKSTKCRIVFRTTVENMRGELEALQVVSDVINCTQLPGTPEILKMSASTSDLKGGGELWIIGKNFLKDTKVVFSHSIVGKKEPLWTKLAEPEQEYFHQTHLITQIPPFYNLDTQEDIEVSVFIKCGEKLSDPLPFTYKPSPSQYMLPQSLANSHDVSLPRGVAAPAVAINQQFAKTGSVSVITGCGINTNGEAPPQAKPTILEHLYDHQNKKSKIEYNSKNSRRTRSVPRPTLINEDTVFVSEGNTKKENFIFTNFSQFPWKEITRASEIQSNYNSRLAQAQSIHSPLLQTESIYKPEIVVPQQNGSAKRSFSIEEDSNTCNFTRDSIVDESSLSPTRTDFSSSLTTDFSNAFSFKRNQACETGTTMSFSGAIYQQPTENGKQQTGFEQTTQNTVIHTDSTSWQLKPKGETDAAQWQIKPKGETDQAPWQLKPKGETEAAPWQLQPQGETDTVPWQMKSKGEPEPAPWQLKSNPDPEPVSWQLKPSGEPEPAPWQLKAKGDPEPTPWQLKANAEPEPSPWQLKAKGETDQPTWQLKSQSDRGLHPEKSSVTCANDKTNEANNDYPNVSVKASSDEKATISISLPTSILKDQKHFQNVIETINNTLLNKHPAHEDEQTKQDSNNQPNYSASICSQTSANSQWPNTSAEQKPFHQVEPEKSGNEWTNAVPVWIQEPTQNKIQQDPTSPNRKITSMPVSVLSNARKRNFSSEPLVQSAGHASTELDMTDAAMNSSAYQDNINSCKSPTANQSCTPIPVKPGHILAENCSMQILPTGKKSTDFNYQLNVNTDISNEKNAAAYPSNSNNLLSKPLSPNIAPPTNIPFENSTLQWEPTTNPTAQEKKWNAEFNEMFQTVVEENKETKLASMDWTANSDQKMETISHKESNQETKKSSMDWNSTPEKPQKDPLMDWCSEAEKKQVPQMNGTPNVESYIVVDQRITNQNVEEGFQAKFQGKEAGLNLPTNNFTGILVNNGNAQPIATRPESENLQLQAGAEAVFYNQKAELNTFQAGKQIIQSSTLTQEPPKCTGGFMTTGIVMNEIPHVDQFAPQVPLDSVEDYAKRQSQNSFQPFNPPPQTQENLNLFDESLVQIQGDPLLSESSSVITLQKNIENAGVASPEKVDNVFEQGSEIPSDQQWAITTPANNEWTYNSTT